VTQNGVLLFGGASFLVMLFTKGSVGFLLVLYSINVFLTFVLSQLGMVRHWLMVKKKGEKWSKGFIINGTGLLLSAFILVVVIYTKFNEGGWITIMITGSLIGVIILVRRHYDHTGKLISKLDKLLVDLNLEDLDLVKKSIEPNKELKPDPHGKTAVLLVNGFSGIGLHSLLSIIKLFGASFSNYVFIQVGLIDTGVFKGIEEINALKEKADEDVAKYVAFMNENGYYAEGFTSIGLDIVKEVMELVPLIKKKYLHCIFFGGQIVFPKDTFYTRLLHNYTVFSVQRKLYNMGHEFVILPIKLQMTQEI
jgi:hypothetical protein